MLKPLLVGMAVLAIAGCGTSGILMKGKPPVIRTIQAESSDVQVGAGIHLKAQVVSESEDLTYAWQANNGLLAKPTETTTLWIAPSAVPFSPYPVTIALTVKDEYGRNVKATYQIRVHQ